MHRLTKAQARRIAVRAQLLDAPRPTDLLTVVRQLTLLQIDPTAAIAPSADLVAWSRLGSTYRPEDLTKALEQDRTLFEHNALVRPMSDLGLLLAGSRTARSHERTHAWIRDNDRFRRDILELLGSSGPLSSRDIPDTCVVPWASTGWRRRPDRALPGAGGGAGRGAGDRTIGGGEVTQRSRGPAKQPWRDDRVWQAGFLVGSALGAAATVLGRRAERVARRGLVDWPAAERIAVGRLRVGARARSRRPSCGPRSRRTPRRWRAIVPRLSQALGTELPGRRRAVGRRRPGRLGPGQRRRRSRR